MLLGPLVPYGPKALCTNPDGTPCAGFFGSPQPDPSILPSNAPVPGLVPEPDPTSLVPTPEPANLLLFGSGMSLLGLWWMRRRRAGGGQ